jgi:hypothetical protein
MDNERLDFQVLDETKDPASESRMTEEYKDFLKTTLDKPVLKIENHAVMFALLCKSTILSRGERGRETIQKAVLRYGNERGKRMADRARANGDPIALWTDRAYREWLPDYEGQMEFGYTETEPTLISYISKCAWCDAWEEHDLLEYGKEYCEHINSAVYEGFCPWFKCFAFEPSLVQGGDKCEFNWTQPLYREDIRRIKEKKEALGNSAIKDFTYHTAHLYYTLSDEIRKAFPYGADGIIETAEREYVSIFGQEQLDVIRDYSETDFTSID